MKLGVIAEDKSDIAVVKHLAQKIISPKKLGVKHFVGNGCGKLRRKCSSWAENLVKQGCKWVMVLHDLDNYDLQTLKLQLETAIANCGAKICLVIIPVREIEAWLLYDAIALTQIFNGSGKPITLPSNPESLIDAKKSLGLLVKKCFGKEYYNTVHNEAIAAVMDPSALRRCPSFQPCFPFLKKIKSQL